MGFTSDRGGFLNEINVTPFVDVMLVLLIIFMVTAPMLTQGVEVDLPKTKTVETLPEESDNLVLSVKKDGSLFLDEYAVKLDALPAQLKKILKGDSKLLYLKADAEVSYGVVVKVMARVKEAGIEKLGVVAEPEEDAS
jgi:biopolymer transport protein TolR